MKRLIILTCGVLCATTFADGPLSEPEKEALLDKLKTLRETAETNVTTRFSGASSAFKKGMASNKAALDFYLKCIEKVNFEERNRSGQDFREWKRRNEQHHNEAFAMALRHQLNWFSLTLRAAANPGEVGKLSPDAAKMIESLLITAEEVDSMAARDELRKPVTNTIFAQAYGLGALKIEGWPMTPLPIAEVYEKVILPPLRGPKTIVALREAWVCEHDEGFAVVGAACHHKNVVAGEHTQQRRQAGVRHLAHELLEGDGAAPAFIINEAHGDPAGQAGVVEFSELQDPDR